MIIVMNTLHLGRVVLEIVLLQVSGPCGNYRTFAGSPDLWVSKGGQSGSPSRDKSGSDVETSGASL